MGGESLRVPIVAVRGSQGPCRWFVRRVRDPSRGDGAMNPTAIVRRGTTQTPPGLCFLFYGNGIAFFGVPLAWSKSSDSIPFPPFYRGGNRGTESFGRPLDVRLRIQFPASGTERERNPLGMESLVYLSILGVAVFGNGITETGCENRSSYSVPEGLLKPRGRERNTYACC